MSHLPVKENARRLVLFITEVSHMPTFEELCRAFHLKEKKKTKNLTLWQHFVFILFKHTLEWLFSPSTNMTVAYILKKNIVEKVLGTEPRRAGHYSNHYTGVYCWFCLVP